jgi:hypothetical protein
MASSVIIRHHQQARATFVTLRINTCTLGGGLHLAYACIQLAAIVLEAWFGSDRLARARLTWGVLVAGCVAETGAQC